MRAAGGILALIVLGVAMLLFVPAGPAGSTTLPRAEPAHSLAGAPNQVTDTNLLDEGRELYLQTCASCHGAAGEGTDFAPPLTDVGAAANDFYMRTGRMPLSRLGVPTWEQERQLTDAQIEAIVAYTSTFGEGPAIPDVVVDLGDLQRGWQLYMNNCAACHGATGGGGGIGGGVVAPPLSRADPLIVAEAMLVGPGAMPRFVLPEEDVSSVAAYVQHLRSQPAPGGLPVAGAGPVPEGLIAALVGVGLLFLVTRWIARRAEFEPVSEPERMPEAVSTPPEAVSASGAAVPSDEQPEARP